MSPHRLVGTWTLLSFETSTADKRIRYPFGRYPAGYLIYTADGWMSVAIMPERRWVSVPALGAGEQRASGRSWLSVRQLTRLARYVLSATRYISYSGPYVVDGDRVIHHVAVSQMPGWLQTAQERTVQVQDNRLVLIAETAGGCQRFVWERVTTPLPTEQAWSAPPLWACPPTSKAAVTS